MLSTDAPSREIVIQLFTFTEQLVLVKEPRNIVSWIGHSYMSELQMYS